MSINLRSQAVQKTLLVIFLAFGGMYAYFNFVYTPRKDKIVKMEFDIDKEQQLLRKGKRIAANFQTVQDDYARLMDSWEIAIELLPTRQEMDGLLKTVSEKGKERDVNFLLFRPMDPVEKPYYWEYPIQIKTLSKYHNLGNFLTDVASLDRIVNVANMNLSSYTPPRGTSPYTVEADFEAIIYVFKELGSPVEVTAPVEEKKITKRRT
jgi:type IV pilus assembly protein PilO